MRHFPVIDLFAGAGGFGVAAASVGADVRLSVEIDPIACETLRLNASPERVLNGDVGELRGTDLRRLASIPDNEPLIIVGGAPCQPFSKAAYWTDPGANFAARQRGQARPPTIKQARPDARRDLVMEFARLVIESEADGFVFENVPSILHPRNRVLLANFKSELEAAGLKLTMLRANGVHYGVAQKRERVFVLGTRARAPEQPEPTHSEDRSMFLAPAISTEQAIAKFAADEYFEPEEIVQGRWAEHLRTVPPGWNYKAHTSWAGHPAPTWETETRFWNFLLKLHPERPSWTLAANPGPWTGPFHWESRRLRTPELAAIQGFPEGYQFSGRRRDRVKQIGNAVPPPLAAPMVNSVIEALAA